MAIWDDAIANEAKTITQSTAVSHKCPGCGSNLLFNDKTKKLQCNSCGSKYYPEYFEISDILKKTINNETEDDSDKNIKQEIVCNSCGYVVVTDHNTASTFCAFCGSPTLVTSRLTKAFKPDTIIPFKIDKDKAVTIFKEWASTSQYLPKDFLSEKTIRKITGLYVPFWLIDADCNINFVGGADKTDGNTIYYYSIKRKGTFKMRRVPFDGSRQINDQLMESIEPFDYSEMVPYSSGYLPGYYAERYDLSADDMAGRISDRFRSYINEERDNYILTTGYEKYIVDVDNSNSSNYSCLYSLLPVWFLSYEYDGLYYKIAINGQTGEIGGTAPVDEKRKRNKKILHYVLGYTKLVILLALISVAVGFLLTTPFGKFIDYKYRLFMSLQLFVFITIPTVLTALLSKGNSVLSKIMSKLIKNIDEEYEEVKSSIHSAPIASTYIDTKDKISLEIKEDKLINVVVKPDHLSD